MKWIKMHLHDKLLAGLLAAVPLVVVFGAASSLEAHTEPLAKPLGVHFPGLGFVLALVLIYLLGVIVTSFLGRVALGLVDRLLCQVPALSHVYRTWKDVLIVSPREGGVFHQVVLVGSPSGPGAQLGFTSGHGLPGDPNSICVFLPGIPSMLSGRLVIVSRDSCTRLDISVEEAFTFLVSMGNHLPAGLRGTASCPAPNGLAIAPAPASPGGNPA
jgi:uncharacterized membrane protein